MLHWPPRPLQKLGLFCLLVYLYEYSDISTRFATLIHSLTSPTAKCHVIRGWQRCLLSSAHLAAGRLTVLHAVLGRHSLNGLLYLSSHCLARDRNQLRRNSTKTKSSSMAYYKALFCLHLEGIVENIYLADKAVWRWFIAWSLEAQYSPTSLSLVQVYGNMKKVFSCPQSCLF